MKKVLLIIATTLLIFQMIVLATDIDIGDAATDRQYAHSNTEKRTVVNKGNPANASGTITSIEIWIEAGDDATNCEVATFFVVSGNNLSTRDTESIGTITAGSKQTVNVNLDVEEGDYIGFCADITRISIDISGGSGIWYTAAGTDNIPCTNVTFSVYSGWMMSLYGTGTTEEEEEEANAIWFGTDFQN